MLQHPLFLGARYVIAGRLAAAHNIGIPILIGIIKTKVEGAMFFFNSDETPEAYRSSLGERIAYAVDKSKTKSDAANAAGVSSEQLNKWIKGTVKVPAEALRSLAAFTGVDFSWLVTGEGDMLQAQRVGIQPLSTGGPADLDQPGMIAIPRYDEVRASAGLGSAPISETPTTRVAFEQRWLSDIGVQPSSAVILAAQGDSMEPTIRNGSPLLVDTSKTEVKSGFIYVIAVGDDLLVKRVRRRLDGLVELISDNSAYAPETLGPDSLQQLRVIGRVYAAVSKF